MRRVHTGPVLGLLALLMLLVALAVTVGLGGPGWVAGVAAGAGGAVALAGALARRPEYRLGPADAVTLTRAVLVGGVAALSADAVAGGPAPVGILVTLAATALLLDAVDGVVARRSDTASELGARFDMEVDAFLILVLSGYVASTTGWWVLAIGAARYVFVAATWVLPWLRAALPARFWGKVVAALAGVALTVAAAQLLPPSATVLVLVVVLALLAESFGHQVRGLWRLHRATASPAPTDEHPRVPAGAGAPMAERTDG
ncbi:MAG TPA: CDP-alcohol phosphatidyltransferase family protein [Actinomycetes bacterium]|nr:CDP-alcohol phosphatidyltransferase family protein [Actinomycetes bacterium]